MAIITYPLNDIMYNAENAETYLCTRTSGVFSADGHFSATVTSERQVTISAGLAWINNSDFTGKSVCNTSSVAVTIPYADGALSRIDRIVLRFDKGANASVIVLKQGESAAQPVPPNVERTEVVYELGLCTVSVPAASTVVSQADVTDTRMDEAVCGLMRDSVTKIPTEQLQAQAEALITGIRTETERLINELEDAIIGVKTGTDVMLASVYGGSELGTVAKADAATRTATADKLGTARKIGNASFDGTADISLAAIGAQPAGFLFKDTAVPVAAWAEDATYAGYPYRAAVELAGVTAGMCADVIFCLADAESGTYAGVNETYGGGVYLYASAVPAADVTIPTIAIWRWTA